MMRYSFILLYVLFGLLSLKAAEPDRLSGKVTDSDTGEPISGVIVKAKGAFTSTDRQGHFELSPKSVTDSISFRCIGYETLTLPLSADLNNVHLNQKTTQLNDIIVEAPDIYAKGDTLVFNVSRYANSKDNAIIDVIKRLPGIKVKEDGTIEYQGKPINKFYLDGNDFLGGQYGLATNNISHKDVKSVEVMENHQPIKALEGIEFPEEAGINLKLKDDARSRWVGVAKAASGIEPFLYNGSVFTMRMAPKIQNMFTLKADNTGWNPANEILDHDFELLFSSENIASLWPEYISADLINAPLSDRRTRNNLSSLANAITAWKTGDTSMRLKFNYMGDRLDYNSGVITDYFSEQIPAFIQNNIQRSHRHDLSAQFYSETNKQGYYMKEKLTLTGVMNKSRSAITGSTDLLQNVDRKCFSIENDLKLVKRNDKKLFNITSRNSFYHRPEYLTISGEDEIMQHLGSTDFRSVTETNFGKLTRFRKYYLAAGFYFNYHRINNMLSGLGDFDNTGVHDSFLYNFFITPQVDYDRNGWRISLSLPLKLYHYSVAGQHDNINVNPRIKVWRQLDARSELSGSLSYGLSSPQAYLNLKVPVLSDYRNLFIAYNPDKYSQNVNTSLSYKFRNALRALFFNISVKYNYYRSYIMSDQLFLNNLIITTYSEKLSHNDTWNFNGGFSKGLRHGKILIGTEINGSFSKASSMRDNDVIPYRQFSASLKPYFKGCIIRWISINYEAEYGFSKLNINRDRSIVNTLHQNLFTTYIPNDYVNITFGAEHYFTRFPEGNKANLLLLDASAVWNVSKKVRLSLTANNILNKHRYEYVNYGTLSRSEHRFSIRHRTILATIQYRF